MRDKYDRHGLMVLSEDQCYERLRMHHIGRLAIATANGPEIYPVNYAISKQREVIFRSTIGRKWVQAIWGHTVGFEIDDYSIESHTGFSVLLTGKPKAVDEADHEELGRLRVRAWGSPEATQWVRIVPERISGRVIPRGLRVWRDHSS